MERVTGVGLITGKSMLFLCLIKEIIYSSPLKVQLSNVYVNPSYVHRKYCPQLYIEFNGKK